MDYEKNLLTLQVQTQKELILKLKLNKINL